MCGCRRITRPDVRPGMTATFTVPQYPNRVFTRPWWPMPARWPAPAAPSCCSSAPTIPITRCSRAPMPICISPCPRGANGIRLPATALMFRDEGMQVATVDASNHVRLKTVNILRDHGRTRGCRAAASRPATGSSTIRPMRCRKAIRSRGSRTGSGSAPFRL